MTKAEFNHALRSTASQEFENIPCFEADIPYSFSQSFERKKESLIKSEKTVCWHWVNTAGKRAAILFVVLACVLSAVFSVEAVRKPVVDFFVEVFTNYWHIQPEGSTTKEITYECIPNFIPEDYVLQEEHRTLYYVSRTYANEQGHQLTLEQTITTANDIYLDNMQGEIARHTVNGNTVILYKGTNHNGIYASWISDGYHLSIISYGNLSVDSILEIIRNYK